MNLKNLKLIMVMFFILIPAQAIFAGPTFTKEISFNFKINETLEGKWNMYFISVGEFNTNEFNFDDYKIIEDYIRFKENCGINDTFYEEIYKMSDDERQHKGCVINGTYQQIYCFRTTTDKKECKILSEYKLDYNKQLNFKSYYDSYMWDIQRAEWYRHYEVSHCEIENNSCTFTINMISTPYNPYIIVLEKLNTQNEIYFSDKTDIIATEIFNKDKEFECGSECNVHKDIKLKISKFDFDEKNKLNIEFDYNNSVIQEPNKISAKKPLEKLIDWLRIHFHW